MHAPVEKAMGKRPTLQPSSAIGPAVRAVGRHILTHARAAILDPERSKEDAVHQFRRAMKEWRALMRLMEPFIPDAPRWRQDARNHARSLGHARDGQAALNAFDSLIDKGMVLSERTTGTIRDRIEALRGSEEAAVLTLALRDAIAAWIDTAEAAIELWPLDPFDFSSIAGQMAASYRSARKRLPADWSAASAEDLHDLRRRVVDLRYQMALIEPLWPRFGRMWIEEAERLRDRLGRCQDIEVLKRLTGLHQPLAHWRSRLTPACADRSAELTQRAARIAARLFSEKPKAFRQRLETLWEHGR
jgi:CHAD domain-containing protein